MSTSWTSALREVREKRQCMSVYFPVYSYITLLSVILFYKNVKKRKWKRYSGSKCSVNANVSATVNSIHDVLCSTIIYCLAHINIMTCFPYYLALYFPRFALTHAGGYVISRRLSLSTCAHGYSIWNLRKLRIDFLYIHRVPLSTWSIFLSCKKKKGRRITVYFQFLTPWGLSLCEHISVLSVCRGTKICVLRKLQYI